MNYILDSAKKIQAELVHIRREIHKNPEAGDHLPVTTEYVKKKLREYGYDPIEICDSGIVAVIEGKEDSCI